MSNIHHAPSVQRLSSFVLLFLRHNVRSGCSPGGVWVQEGGSGGGEEKQTPYGLEELEFLAQLQDADPEH